MAWEPRSGLVSLAGRPNVGKSTLLNRLVGAGLGIVSPKPQTTWTVVRGILTEPRGQAVFVDTPGLHRPLDTLGSLMVSAARRALDQSDLVFWLADCRAPAAETLAEAGRYLGKKVPALLLLNKVDLIAKPLLLPLIATAAASGLFREIVPVSALRGDNLDTLLDLAFRDLPPGEPLFPADQLSESPERDLMREFIREKVFLNTREEIPYASAVRIEFVKTEEKRLLVGAVIFVEKESQKGILVGKGGEMIKRIGTQARIRIQGLVGMPVFLDLRVKVRKNWRTDPRSLSEFGYRI